MRSTEFTHNDHCWKDRDGANSDGDQTRVATAKRNSEKGTASFPLLRTLPAGIGNLVEVLPNPAVRS